MVTLFHEFGHLVHHVLGGRPAVGPVLRRRHRVGLRRGAEPDARGVGLGRRRAADLRAPTPTASRSRPTWSSGCARPTTSARATHARTQMFYAAMSYWFHTDRPDDLTATMRELQERYSLFRLRRRTPTSSPSFGHLERLLARRTTPTCGRLVIAKDLFSAFDPDDLFAPEVPHRYRDRVLAPGGARDAADLVEDFLGRPYAFDAYARLARRLTHSPRPQPVESARRQAAVAQAAVSQVMPRNWHSPWEISHGECQFSCITWETGSVRADSAGQASGAGAISASTVISADSAGVNTRSPVILPPPCRSSAARSAARTAPAGPETVDPGELGAHRHLGLRLRAADADQRVPATASASPGRRRRPRPSSAAVGPGREVDRAVLPPRPDLLGHVGQERREQPQLHVRARSPARPCAEVAASSPPGRRTRAP